MNEQTAPTANETARKHLTDVLAGRRSSYDLDRTNPHTNICREVLMNLEGERDEFERQAEGIRRDLELSAPYVRGEIGSWNNLGIMQSRATRVEQIAWSFQRQSQLAMTALVSYYTA
jgi:hypothetical protein